jgi:hypothetical protein
MRPWPRIQSGGFRAASFLATTSACPWALDHRLNGLDASGEDSR